MSKFKVGDKVTGTIYGQVIFGQVETIEEVLFAGYRLKDRPLIWLDSELKLAEPEPDKPKLTNTVITDIKDEAQHQRVQKKLFEMGVQWYYAYGGPIEIIKSNETKILISNYLTMHDGIDNTEYPHVTANEFLGEEPVEIPDGYLDIKVSANSIGDQMSHLITTKNGFLIPELPQRYFGPSAAGYMIDYLSNNGTSTNDEPSNIKPMSSIVNFFNDLTVSAEDKELRKAGLKDSDLSWTDEAKIIVGRLESKERGYKTYQELCEKVGVDRGGSQSISVFEMDTLFTKFYDELLDTAKKFNAKEEKKSKQS